MATKSVIALNHSETCHTSFILWRYRKTRKMVCFICFAHDSGS